MWRNATATSINETLRTDRKNKGYEFQAVILRAGVQIGTPLVEPAQETQVLAAQVRLAGAVVDALKVNVALAPAQGASAVQPSSDDYYKSAQTYEKTDPDLAIALYRRAIVRDSSNTDAKLALASTYTNKNKTDEALKILNAPEFESSAYGQYLRSVAYTYADSLDATLKNIKPSAELEPDMDACYYWRGYVYDRRKDYAKAVQDYETARKLNPSDANYYEYSARVEEKLGKYDEAIAVLEAGRKQTSEGSHLATLLNYTQRRAAAHYIDSGKTAEAMRYALASVKDDENSEWGQRLVGIAHRKMGNLPEAAKSLERALKIQPTMQAYSELAGVRLDQGNKKEAFALAEKGIELDSTATLPYGVLEKGIKGPEDAKEVIDWLKVYAAKNPPAHIALVEWDYFQLLYRPNDSGEITDLYSAYDTATKSVPYSDWLDGWTNFVELSLIQGKSQQAATTAAEILKVTPKLEYQVPMLFYQWVAVLLDGNCVVAQNALRELTDFLARPELNDYQNSWIYKGTRVYLDAQSSRGVLDSDSYAVIQSALTLLESRPMKRTQTDAFLTKIRTLKNPPCPSRASSSP